jgi:hypothetical protein
MARTSKEIPARSGLLTGREGIRGRLLIGLREWRLYFPFKNRRLAQDGINIEAVEFRVNRMGKVNLHFKREDLEGLRILF